MQKPTIDQFDITDDESHYFDYFHHKYEDISNKIFLYFYAIICLLLIFYFYRKTSDIVISIFIVFLVGLPIAGISFLSLYYFFISIINPQYREISKRVKNFERAKNEYDLWWRRTQQDFWLSLSGKGFEHELSKLYSRMGYQVHLTPTSGDQGIDIILDKEGKRTIVQCKAHKKPVGPHVIRDLYGTLMSSGADEAILASVSGFTSGVVDYASGRPIRLISINDIIDIQRRIT